MSCPIVISASTRWSDAPAGIAYGVPPGGGGHDHRVALAGTTLIVTPGSPNLPVRHGTVARLTFTEIVDVEIVHLAT